MRGVAKDTCLVLVADLWLEREETMVRGYKKAQPLLLPRVVLHIISS